MRESISRVVEACAAAAVVGVCALVLAAPALATIPPGLTSACPTDSTPPENYVFCDDGVPGQGGTTPNTTGALAVTVPARYQTLSGDTFTGLPPQALDAGTLPGADPVTGTVALDVDISYPASGSGPLPLIVMMHGCCSGDKTSWESSGTPGQRFDAPGESWHYNNAWFASRGYVVINYTARGFVNNQNHGSTGETQLDSRSFEINDYQDLACQVTQLFNTTGLPNIDPTKVVPTGGSYGGGFAWLALTDPAWNCQNAGVGPTFNFDMGLAAAAPRYGWTDLAYSLVPTGMHFGEPSRMPDINGCDTGPSHPDGSGCPAPQNPSGLPKTSILGILYFSGTIGLPPGFSHTTFSPSIGTAFTCLLGSEAALSSPACAGIPATLAEYLRERSAYYQSDFFGHVANNDLGYKVPVYDAATFTDPLFTSVENRRMINRLRSIDANYPVQAYYGDYEHFVQNKAKVWGDTCGGDHHVCSVGDYPGTTPADFDAAPASRVREGVTTRLNAFIDHYATTATGGPPDPGTPVFDVTGELQVCPQNAGSLGANADDGGPQFTAPTFEQLAPNTLTVNASGAQTTTNKAAPNTHAATSDPLQNFLANGGKCPVEMASDPAGAGVASYTSDALPSDFTMLGGTTVRVDFAGTGPVGQMNARLYDVLPNGDAVMVDRGPRRLTTAEASGGSVTYELHGNGWRFSAGHRVRIELAQDDDPFVHRSDTPSSASLSGAVLRIPIREASATINARPTLQSGRCANKTVGTVLGEKLVGSPKGDQILGGAGRDRISGLAGKDCLNGQAGNDRVSGGKANDSVKGGNGKDKLSGGSGKDKLIGGKGKDRMNGGAGNDQLLARDHKRDVVNCGKGKHDRAVVDRVDKVRGCEKVK
jgi:dienelactone hydrolase